MGELCHKVLKNKAVDIVRRLSSPDFMARVYLRKFFSDVECDRIECQTTNCGDSAGSAALLDLINKKEAGAFSAFLEALRRQALKDLAEDLEAELLELQAHQPASNVDRLIEPQPTNQQTPNPKPADSGTLLRHIPEAVFQMIVRLLDIPSPNDWRAIAGHKHMDLTAEDVQALEPEKTRGLLKIMFEKNMQLCHLVELLVQVDRKDVLDELKTEGIISDTDVRPTTYEETAV